MKTRVWTPEDLSAEESKRRRDARKRERFTKSLGTLARALNARDGREWKSRAKDVRDIDDALRRIRALTHNYAELMFFLGDVDDIPARPLDETRSGTSGDRIPEAAVVPLNVRNIADRLRAICQDYS